MHVADGMWDAGRAAAAAACTSSGGVSTGADAGPADADVAARRRPDTSAGAIDRPDRRRQRGRRQRVRRGRHRSADAGCRFNPRPCLVRCCWHPCRGIPGGREWLTACRTCAGKQPHGFRYSLAESTKQPGSDSVRCGGRGEPRCVTVAKPRQAAGKQPVGERFWDSGECAKAVSWRADRRRAPWGAGCARGGG